MKSNKLPINREIQASRMVVIDVDGTKLGEFLKEDAVRLAEKVDLDLVMVSEGDKPVCRIMDYGKFLYEQKKKAKQNSSHSIETKEIKLGYQTEQNYIDIKTAQARKFLERGDKVKVTIQFVGREIAHTDLIRKKCLGVYDALKDIADVESPPKMAGRQMNMILVAKK